MATSLKSLAQTASVGYTGSRGANGYTGSQGTQGIQGVIGYTGSQGIQGNTGALGYTGSQGVQGTAGPSTAVNATNDTTSTSLYPVMVNAAGSNQTPKVSTGKIYFNAVTGTIYAAAKSFRIPHPTQPGKHLVYGSLEGPENGVYVRGTLKGSVIELPEYWINLVDPDSITVQLTPIGKHQNLYVDCIRDNKVYVVNDGIFADEVNCYYYVLAERIDVDKLEVEIG